MLLHIHVKVHVILVAKYLRNTNPISGDYHSQKFSVLLSMSEQRYTNKIESWYVSQYH